MDMYFDRETLRFKPVRHRKIVMCGYDRVKKRYIYEYERTGVKRGGVFIPPKEPTPFADLVKRITTAHALDLPPGIHYGRLVSWIRHQIFRSKCKPRKHVNKLKYHKLAEAILRERL